MSEMVERVARALYAIRMEVAEGAGLHEPYTWETDNNAYREHCLREARAAIKAMREPTQGMLDCRDAFVKADDARIVWQLQIDAALSPHDPTEKK
jgi:hypothetical protein